MYKIELHCKRKMKHLLSGKYQLSNIIASIIEPVRGEGGIYETKLAVADYLSQQSFPLISDEIQCGLGRTGTSLLIPEHLIIYWEKAWAVGMKNYLQY